MVTDIEYIHIALRLRQNLLHIAMNYLGNAEDAEDAVQDVLLHLWMVRQRLIAGKEANGLLSTMMRNHCVNMLRRRKPETVSLEMCDVASEPDALQCLENQQNNLLLRRAVSTLPLAERRLFLMRQQAGMEVGQIASLMGMTSRSVSTMVSSARRKVLDFLVNNQ